MKFLPRTKSNIPCPNVKIIIFELYVEQMLAKNNPWLEEISTPFLSTHDFLKNEEWIFIFTRNISVKFKGRVSRMMLKNNIDLLVDVAIIWYYSRNKRYLLLLLMFGNLTHQIHYFTHSRDPNPSGSIQKKKTEMVTEQMFSPSRSLWAIYTLGHFRFI